MYTQQRQSRFDWGQFISGVIFLLVGFFMMRHQGVALRSLVLVFGIGSIIQGIVWLASYSSFRDLFRASWVTLISGIVDLVVGLLFLFYGDFGALTIAILFSIWFLTDSVIGLVFSFHLRDISAPLFLISLVLNIFSLIVALLMLMNPVVSAMTLVLLVAIYLIIYGVNNVIVSFAHRL